MLAQVRAARRRIAVRHDIGGERAFARGIGPAAHGGGGDAVVLDERAFDLLDRDAVAADLHLGVDAAEAQDRAVGATAGEIAGAVQALAGAEWSGTKRSAVSSGRLR